jgi:uroporphyrinogen III methyltransferase/synthase
MGASALPRIVAELLAYGRPSATPVALVRRGTTEGPLTITGSLADIVDKARAAALEPPVVVVVGEVVALAEHLRPHRDQFPRTLALR